jgi:polysaccharide deacetylase family protein (PEP-CTERM system associated)
MRGTRMPITNAMTVDVEDYFQVSAFEGYISRDDWATLPCRVEGNCDRILALFDEWNVKATFFVLGWIAERYPQLIRRMVAAGHELASHGYEHIRVIHQKPDEFYADASRTKKLLEEIGSCPVNGYRAASYSIGAKNLWALEQLQRAGYVYSSSIYPIRHDLYGMPQAPRFAFRPNGSGGILEIPVTTVTLFKQRLPCGGGGYFRLLPYSFFRWALRRVNSHDHKPCIFYFHPWEIDPGQPRQSGLDLKTRFRHYVNLEKMEQRLRVLMSDFRWDRVDRIFLDAPAIGND